MSTLEVKAIQAPTGYDLQMPAGHIIQVVSDVHNSGSHYSTTSTSFVDSELSATITPSSTSNKIIVLVNLGAQTPSSYRGHWQVLRDSTVLTGGGWCGANGTGAYNYGSWGTTHYDSPSTTSAITYKVQIQVTAGTFYYHHAGYISSITLIEVAG